MCVCKTDAFEAGILAYGAVEVRRPFILEVNVKGVQVFKRRVETDCISQVLHTYISKVVHSDLQYFEEFVVRKCTAKPLNVTTFNASALNR